jgi:AcrR family transcriptional regulator
MAARSTAREDPAREDPAREDPPRADAPPAGTGKGVATGRGPRADAVRNRAALLATARRVLSARGLDVPVEEIARDAGVGVGTVYRNFPTKDALLGAVIARAFEDLTADAHAALSRPEAGDAFFGFLRGAAVVMARDRVLVRAARAADGLGVARAPEVQGLFDATDTLLGRAIAAGAVRPGVTAEDVAALLTGVGDAANELGRPTPDGLDRYLAVIVDGLRPHR